MLLNPGGTPLVLGQLQQFNKHFEEGVDLAINAQRMIFSVSNRETQLGEAESLKLSGDVGRLALQNGSEGSIVNRLEMDAGSKLIRMSSEGGASIKVGGKGGLVVSSDSVEVMDQVVIQKDRTAVKGDLTVVGDLDVGN